MAELPSFSGRFVRFPGSPFELFQPYPPAGDQPQAIEALVDGPGKVLVVAPTGSGKTLAAFLWALDRLAALPERPPVHVTDNASTDGTRAVAEAVADPRVRVIAHPANRGASAARNTGVAAARAPFVAFQDSDDEWLPDKTRQQMDWLLARPEFGMVLCNVEHVDRDGARIDFLDINLRGTFVCMKHEIAQMLRQGGGVIVNTASGAGIRGVAGGASYAASKHAVMGFSLSTMADLRAAKVKDVHISCICPDGIWTPMLHDKLDDPEAALSFSASARCAAP